MYFLAHAARYFFFYFFVFYFSVYSESSIYIGMANPLLNTFYIMPFMYQIRCERI